MASSGRETVAMASVRARRRARLVKMAADALAAGGVPQPVQGLAAQLLASLFPRPSALVEELEVVLSEDGRFMRDAAGKWGLAAWHAQGDQEDHDEPEERGALEDDPPPLVPSYLAMAVGLPGEPTGRNEPNGRVRLAAVKVQDGQIADQYLAHFRPIPAPSLAGRQLGLQALPGPGMPAPAEVDRPAQEVLSEFQRWVGEGVLVGRGVSAAVAFLDEQATGLGLPPFDNRLLDTSDLALHLLPAAGRPSLSRLAAALGVATRLRHPALDDARLTAEVVLALLQRLGQRKLVLFPELQQWLTGGAVRGQPGVHLSERPPAAGGSLGVIRLSLPNRRLPLHVLQSLPDHPGVYLVRDADGRVLYVGAARSLRRRITEQFALRAVPPETEGLWRASAAVLEHTPVDSELDALLLAARHQRTYQPVYTEREGQGHSCPILRFEGGTFLRVEPSTAVDDYSAFHYGPYRSPQEVRHTIQAIRRVFQVRSCTRRLPARRPAMRLPCERLAQRLCPAPCADLVTPAQYGILVQYARLFVTAGKRATLEALQARLDALARQARPREQDRWEFDILQECRTRLLRVRKEFRPLPGGLGGGGLLMNYPTADGSLALFYVQDGRPVMRFRVRAEEAANAPAMLAMVENRLARQGNWPELDAGQTNVLLRWIHQHSGQPELIPVAADASRDAMITIVVDAVRRHFS